LLFRKTTTAFILVTVQFIIQCTSNENSNRIEISANYFEININPEEAKEVGIQDLIKDYSYLKLEIPDSLYFSSIEKVLFDDDNIYLLDKSNFQDQILSFDIDGNFNFHINKPGRGPGEFENIYDFDISENAVLLSTPTGLKYYNKENGIYDKTIPDSKNRIESFKLLDKNLIVTEAGRFKSNASQKQIKILDLDDGELIQEAVTFNDHALKGSHSYRYLFRYNDSLSVNPMYDQRVYRVFNDSTDIHIKTAYKVNFGEYWVPDDLLASSYTNLDTFFSEIGNYVSNFEVFETDTKLYVDYKYSGINHAYIYDKQAGKGMNVKFSSNNELGWFGAPVATYKNSIVNTITIQKVADYLPKGNKGDFQQFFSPPNEQNTLVLLFIELE
jgi:hypothetical protein